ncbi:MAG: hypothetical protein DRP71_01595 [Verrucomicrobia bacterium]|nr:MAG: hypothetical protein DRP71_01595 [Verrucomicrobiota bacterium]
MSTDLNISKVKKYLLFLSAVPAMFIVSPVWAADGDTDTPQKGRYQQMLEKYDVDRDGQLSAEEKENARKTMQGQGGRQGKDGQGAPNRQRMMERFDTDGDGRLSPEERDAARAAMQAEGGRGGKGGHGGMNRQAMMERFDTDGDGWISPEERDAARANRQKKGPPPPEQ